MHRFKERVWGVWTAPGKPVVAAGASWRFRKGTLTGLDPYTLQPVWHIENVLADGPIGLEDSIFAVQMQDKESCRMLKINPSSGNVEAIIPLPGCLHGAMRVSKNRVQLLLAAPLEKRRTPSLFYAELDPVAVRTSYFALGASADGFGDVQTSFIGIRGNDKYRSAVLLQNQNRVLLLSPKQNRTVVLPDSPNRSSSRLDKLAQLGDTLLAAVGNRVYFIDLDKEKVVGEAIFMNTEPGTEKHSQNTRIERIGTMGNHIFVETGRRLFHLKASPRPTPDATAHPAHIFREDWPLGAAELLVDGNPDTQSLLANGTTVTMAFDSPVLISNIAVLPSGDAPDPRVLLNADDITPADSNNAALPRAHISAVHTATVQCDSDECPPIGELRIVE